MFTIEQFWSIVRTLLQSAGAALVTKGVIDAGSAEIAVGLIMNIATTGYSLWLRRKAGLVASAAALPEVREIRTTPEIARKVEDPSVTAR